MLTKFLIMFAVTVTGIIYARYGLCEKRPLDQFCLGVLALALILGGVAGMLQCFTS